ncbi:MAG: hypothetical protein M3O71_09890 [Bacteroidota bacterium]|nr:hypothetical protein [Bacteroidota bacterium]
MDISDFIIDRSELRERLEMLRLEKKPLWGKMNPRQMVEHLVDEVTWTNGKKNREYAISPEEAEKGKQIMIYSDVILPKNYYAGDLPGYFIYPTLERAIAQLFTELDDFDSCFTIPGTTAMHPLFGPLNYEEWLIWQGKHFSHHLKQFDLLQEHIHCKMIIA